LTACESVNGGLQLSGAIVARSVVMNGGGQITSTFNGETYEIPVAGTPTASTPFARTRYVECTSETTLGSGC
jgi:hypothetical protein